MINASSGDDVLSPDNASATGSWTPIDTRDPITPASPSIRPVQTHPHRQIHCHPKGSIQHEAQLPILRDILRYTLSFQVSDYFAFKNISITDVISDGQHLILDASHTPQMAINGNNYALGAADIDSGLVDVDCNYTGPGSECDTNNIAANDGTTAILFEVSNEIIRRSGDADGRMVRGCVPNSGLELEISPIVFL